MDLLLITITWLLIGGAVLTAIGMVVFGVICFKAYRDAKIQHDQFNKAMDEKKERFDKIGKEHEEMKARFKKRTNDF